MLLETALQLFDTGADAPVDDGVADGGDDPSNDGRIDDDLEIDLAAGGVCQSSAESLLLIIAQRNC